MPCRSAALSPTNGRRPRAVPGDIVRKDPKVAHEIWARELGLKGAWAEAIFESVPPPLIREWTNPRYTYSLIKGGPLYQRLDFLAHYMFRQGYINEPVDLSTSMDASLIAEVLKHHR